MLQLDHMYVFTEPGAIGLKEFFVENGFTLAPGRNHKGQGTANQCVMFNNAYFEAIWAVDDNELKSDVVKGTKLYERSTWRQSGFSPFGVALRFDDGDQKKLPFPTHDYHAPFAEVPIVIKYAKNSGSVGEPFIFNYPLAKKPTINEKIPVALLNHPNGAKEITSLRITLPDRGGFSEAVQKLIELNICEFVRGNNPLMEIFLDHAEQKKVVDLLPKCPLKIYF